MKQKLAIALFILVLTVLPLTSCIHEKVVEDETVKVGAILMLSGDYAIEGINAQKGIELAANEINQRGGVLGKRLEIKYEDNQADNTQLAVSALYKFIQQDVHLVLGPIQTPSGLATAPIACSNKVLMISPNIGVSEFNKECDFIFKTVNDDALNSEFLGKYLYEKGYRKIGVLGSLQTWEKIQAESVKKGFEKAGGEVVSFQLVKPDEKDFSSIITKIKNTNPEVIIFANYNTQHLSAKKSRELGIIASFYSILVDQSKIDAAQGALEETVVVTSFTPKKDFVEKYNSLYKEEVSRPADSSYDVIMLLAQAIEETKSTDPTVLKEYLNSLEIYDGASGFLTFDEMVE